MPTAMSADDEWDYVLKEERDESGQPKPDATTFILGVIGVAAEASIEDRGVLVNADKTMIVRSGSQTTEILRAGLRGWRNFNDASGKPVQFETSKANMRAGKATVTDDALTRLAPSHRKELANAIVERNTISESEAKNSSSAPAS